VSVDFWQRKHEGKKIAFQINGAQTAGKSCAKIESRHISNIFHIN
jgi:hypothetical protein